MKPKEFFFLLYYSGKELVDEFINIIMEVKRPKFWFYVSFSLLVYGIYSKNATLVKIAMPIAMVIYIIRQSIDGA